MVLPKPGEGPSKNKMRNGFFRMKIIGFTDQLAKIIVTVNGDSDPGYSATAKMLTETAISMILNEDKLPLQRLQLEQEGEIGPIKYVAEVIYGQDESVKYLDNAVRWVIYALIFVFDPLAILLLITSAGIIQRRAREEKPQVVENRYVLQIPKEKMDSIKKPS